MEEAKTDFKEAQRLIAQYDDQEDPVIKQYVIIVAAWLKSCERLTPEMIKKSFKVGGFKVEETRPWSLKRKVALCSLVASTALFAGVVYLKN